MALEAGSRLGHYRILGLLGRGGMAEVYRAEDERLGREVALKVLPPEFSWDPERVERFEREVRAAAKLNHANIVTVYEYGEGEGLHFYTMALLPGGELKGRIRASPGGMPPTEAAAIAGDVARALDYAHKQGFVHRDVKPENILFDQDGSPQLTDFGIARAMSEGTRMTATGMSIGSPHYMSPEQARGQAVDGRSDLYSLGVVFYEMLTGRVPFDAPDTFAVGLSHINDPVPPLPVELAGWQPLVDRLLAKSPEDRHGSGEELLDALAAGPSASRAREGQFRRESPPPQVRVPATRILPGMDGPSSRPSSSRNPRRALVAAVAGTVLVLAAAAGGYVALRSPQAPERGRPAEEDRRVENPASPQALLGGSAVLAVATTPPGAEVHVDGQFLGRTPLTRSDLGAGLRDVAIEHSHYETVHLRAQRFAENAPLRLERTLTRGAGSLDVDVTPRNALVEVNGERLARESPVELEGLPAGPTEVRLSAPEHRTTVVDVEIPKDGVLRLERALTRIPYGSLTLDLEPRGARVTLPDVEPRYRPGVRLPQGRHRVIVRSDGYQEVVRTVDVSGVTTVRIALDRLPEPVRYGTLTLALEPPSATVLLPDTDLRYQPGMRLPEGSYRVVVRSDGYREAADTVSVRGATRTRIALEPDWAPLTVAATPSSAQVRLLDHDASYRDGMVLPPGTYRVEVSAPDYVTQEETVRHGTSVTSQRVELRADPDVFVHVATVRNRGSAWRRTVDGNDFEIRFDEIVQSEPVWSNRRLEFADRLRFGATVGFYVNGRFIVDIGTSSGEMPIRQVPIRKKRKLEAMNEGRLLISLLADTESRLYGPSVRLECEGSHRSGKGPASCKLFVKKKLLR